MGVDRPIKALSLYIQKPFRGIWSKFSLLSFCQKLYFLHKLLHAYVHYVYMAKVKYWINSAKAVVGVDWPMKALSFIYKS